MLGNHWDQGDNVPSRCQLAAVFMPLTMVGLGGLQGDCDNQHKCRRLQGHSMIRTPRLLLILPTFLVIAGAVNVASAQKPTVKLFNRDVAPLDWPMLGGSPARNNTPQGKDIPTDWDVETGRNIKWSAKLGSQSYGNVVVANGKVFVGTNNGAGYLKRYPKTVDLGVLLCFRESDGKFLWQYSCEKLRSGRVHDWPMQGICSAPVAEGDRLWFVSSRGEVVCLDADGFEDNENDGPHKSEPNENSDEADIVWSFDMMKELGVRQHNMATCAPAIWGNALFICTSNGVDESHAKISAPDAPSFIAMDKHTGEILWTDNSPGPNILHGQWSCPTIGVFEEVPQVLFPGGDGWLYSFRADRWSDGKPELLWKFDGNPKKSKWILGGRGTRNNMIAVPVIHEGLVYVAMGQDPEHGDGTGHLWCLDPRKRGDVSAGVVLDKAGSIVPHRRLQAFVEWETVFEAHTKVWDGLNEGRISNQLRKEFEKANVPLPDSCNVKTESVGSEWLITTAINGAKAEFKLKASSYRSRGTQHDHLTVGRWSSETLKPNPNSAVVWHYDKFDTDGNGEFDFEEEMHRTLGSPTIKDGLLFIVDTTGIVHCIDAKTGQSYWNCDLLAESWSTPLIVEDKVLIGDEDGDMAILRLSSDPNKSTKMKAKQNEFTEPLDEISMRNSVYTMPIVANNVLFIATKDRLFAIETQSE